MGTANSQLRNTQADEQKQVDRVSNIGEYDLKKYEYPFENIVFEGGGGKGLAYCGALKYLHEVGVLPNIKRVAGTSVGAITAALVAIGYEPDELRELMGANLDKTFKDANTFTGVRNILIKFGWHPGNKAVGWMGDIISRKTGSPDITFEQVRRKYGRELCIVVTNLNRLCPTYFHPKTTPDVPIRIAVRMSFSIPGLFTAPEYRVITDNITDVVVDGGLICNYPVHCFDGWFLSMKKEDNLVKRLLASSLDDLPEVYDSRFNPAQGDYDKTLGFMLFSENERDYLRGSLERNSGKAKPDPPDTELFREWTETNKEMETAKKKVSLLQPAMEAFMKALDNCNHDQNNNINQLELEEAMQKREVTTEHKQLLFGDISKDNMSGIFKRLDHNDDGKIDYIELTSFMAERGINLQNQALGWRKKDIKTNIQFIESIYQTMALNSKRLTMKPADVDRTVGINTGYIGTTDFKMDSIDKMFLVERGYFASREFFKNYVKSHPKLKVKTDNDQIK